MKENSVVLILGSNLYNREELLRKAIEALEERLGEKVAISSVYESEPWGFDSEYPFLNQAVEINTNLSAPVVLRECLDIEKSLGRIRGEGDTYQDRTIDIDIMLFGNEVVNTPDLEIPHPRMHQRMFCMLPIAEINSDRMIPGQEKTVRDLLIECTDQSEVFPLHAKV